VSGLNHKGICSFDHKDEAALCEHLREHAIRVAGGSAGDSNYDPETLALEFEAAKCIGALREIVRVLRREPPAHKGPTVQVRIALCVDKDGDYYATGWRDESGKVLPGDDALVQCVRDCMGCWDKPPALPESWHFITAEVPLPQAAEVKGEVASG
jgi:hypothetical protein